MMNIAQARCIPIENYLSRQGHKPTHSKHQGQELWYHSPIRDGDNNPSFKVNTIKNLWYDHGAARGGTIIDLVREIYACDIRDALAHLDKSNLYSPALNSPISQPPSQILSPIGTKQPSKSSQDGQNFGGEKEKNKALEIVKISKLTHPALLEYLAKRKIDSNLASQFCSQIDFKRPGSAGSYFGLGYPAGDGFEVRNALFKGFVGSRKDIFAHDVKNATNLLVFEGFIDALSYLTVKKETQPTHSLLILNSTNLWRRAIPHIQDTRYEKIELFLDNDSAGSAASAKIIETSNRDNIHDMRPSYAAFDDLNAWLVARNH